MRKLGQNKFVTKQCELYNTSLQCNVRLMYVGVPSWKPCFPVDGRPLVIERIAYTDLLEDG